MAVIAGRRPGWRIPNTSAAWWSIRRMAKLSTPAPSGICGMATRSAAFSRRPMPEKPGTRFSSGMTAQAAPTWRWTPRIQVYFMRPCGTCDGSLTTSAPADPVAACSRARTPGQPGTNSAKVCPRAIWDASVLRSLPVTARAYTRWWKQRTTPLCSGPTMPATVGKRSTIHSTSADGRFILRVCRLIPGMPIASISRDFS